MQLFYHHPVAFIWLWKMHLFFCDAIVAEKNSFEFFISHAKTLFCYDQKYVKMFPFSRGELLKIECNSILSLSGL